MTKNGPIGQHGVYCHIVKIIYPAAFANLPALKGGASQFLLQTDSIGTDLDCIVMMSFVKCLAEGLVLKKKHHHGCIHPRASARGILQHFHKHAHGCKGISFSNPTRLLAQQRKNPLCKAAGALFVFIK